ncbi:hypothetical protein [Novosphingobium umbonatum]|uniref:hypothetical protein n=1 Tax=Novosphingobium umbonatum TaxID=1908524 RepID=UPI001FEADE82|nr:hypothetical protein [Novosphingobium umbonatum]
MSRGLSEFDRSGYRSQCHGAVAPARAARIDCGHCTDGLWVTLGKVHKRRNANRFKSGNDLGADALYAEERGMLLLGKALQR